MSWPYNNYHMIISTNQWRCKQRTSGRAMSAVLTWPTCWNALRWNDWQILDINIKYSKKEAVRNKKNVILVPGNQIIPWVPGDSHTRIPMTLTILVYSFMSPLVWTGHRNSVDTLNWCWYAVRCAVLINIILPDNSNCIHEKRVKWQLKQLYNCQFGVVRVGTNTKLTSADSLRLVPPSLGPCQNSIGLIPSAIPLYMSQAQVDLLRRTTLGEFSIITFTKAMVLLHPTLHETECFSVYSLSSTTACDS